MSDLHPSIRPLAVIAFEVAGEAHGRPRGRVGAFKNKKTGKYQGRYYHPAKISPNSKRPADRAWIKANAWEAAILAALKGKIPRAPWVGAVRCTIDVYRERPQRLQKKSSPQGPILCTTKPDRDNADKAILDAMTRAGVWEDDQQVCLGPVRKWYAAKGCGPGVVVLAEHLGDPVEIARAMEGLACSS